jgi:hypothetical protein
MYIKLSDKQEIIDKLNKTEKSWTHSDKPVPEHGMGLNRSKKEMRETEKRINRISDLENENKELEETIKKNNQEISDLMD